MAKNKKKAIPPQLTPVKRQPTPEEIAKRQEAIKQVGKFIASMFKPAEDLYDMLNRLGIPYTEQVYDGEEGSVIIINKADFDRANNANKAKAQPKKQLPQLNTAYDKIRRDNAQG